MARGRRGGGAVYGGVTGNERGEKQFFPTSDRPEVLVEVQMPYGSSIIQTSAATANIERWLQQQPEAKIVTSYIGRARRAFTAMAPELPDPSFAKLVVLTDGPASREALKLRLREAVANGWRRRRGCASRSWFLVLIRRIRSPGG